MRDKRRHDDDPDRPLAPDEQAECARLDASIMAKMYELREVIAKLSRHPNTPPHVLDAIIAEVHELRDRIEASFSLLTAARPTTRRLFAA
jgi:hypothetical protein